jgi:hypothetical protein
MNKEKGGLYVEFGIFDEDLHVLEKDMDLEYYSS